MSDSLARGGANWETADEFVFSDDVANSPDSRHIDKTFSEALIDAVSHYNWGLLVPLLVFALWLIVVGILRRQLELDRFAALRNETKEWARRMAEKTKARVLPGRVFGRKKRGANKVLPSGHSSAVLGTLDEEGETGERKKGWAMVRSKVKELAAARDPMRGWDDDEDLPPDEDADKVSRDVGLSFAAGLEARRQASMAASQRSTETGGVGDANAAMTDRIASFGGAGSQRALILPQASAASASGGARPSVVGGQPSQPGGGGGSMGIAAAIREMHIHQEARLNRLEMKMGAILQATVDIVDAATAAGEGDGG